jgi:hypothetical protein
MTSCKIFYKLGKQQRMEESKGECMVKKFWLIRYIHEQLGISKEGTLDVANATFDEVKTTLMRITSPHVFVENEQWNVVCMKEEFHAIFVAIL